VIKVDTRAYLYRGGRPDISNLATYVDQGLSKKDLKDIKSELTDSLEELQERLFAEGKQSVLLVLQAMDAAGKDSTIEKLTLGLNAQGCQIHAFKKPSDIEMSHDFLWRIHKRVPSQGEITLFNRSHYEDVLIVKVHEWASEQEIERRYDYINSFESSLRDRGTKVIKIMLNVSPDYQLERFKRRLRLAGKNWKFNAADLEERKYWQTYMEAFANAIQRCASEDAPWYIVPAENRKFRDALIAQILHDALTEMNPQYPKPDYDRNLFTPESIS
jgi:PPK2 family polyphosphate:nucleotide phosphotransferase